MKKPKTVEFTEYEVKEISKKDPKTMRKYADGLRKKGFAISPVPKEEKRTIIGPRKCGRTYKLKIDKVESNKTDGYYFPKLKDLVVNEEGDNGYGEWKTFKKAEK